MDTATVAIVVALIGMVGSVWGQWLISRKNRREDDAKQAVKDALMESRLDSIEKKLDEHNGYAKRFEEVAVSLAELRTELKLKGNG